MSHRQKISVARKLLRHIFTRFQPSIPFAADQEKKGIWAAVAKAQPHTWQKHQVTLSSELQIATPVRMLVLSDLHVGSHSNDLQRLSQIVAEVAQRQFDLLLLPGDFVNMQVFGGGRVRPERVARTLAPLVSKAPVFAVLGNHDSEYGADHVERCLNDIGIGVLRNSSAKCSAGSGSFYVVGLEDESTGLPDFELASRSVPDGAMIVAMAHDPASLARLPDKSMLMVSGHTHGGQVRLPWVGPVINASNAPWPGPTATSGWVCANSSYLRDLEPVCCQFATGVHRKSLKLS